MISLCRMTDVRDIDTLIAIVIVTLALICYTVGTLAQQRSRRVTARSVVAAVIVGTGDVGQPLAFQGFAGRPLAANGGRIDPFPFFGR